ncbi:heart- and neural crest derivatives-expressed protein 2-like [Liolophura sinensis]|uniref:heart- and neural crest derivatives-expressed protein 2-like n=1 Tax=Liolophura sinensis TaxID=3198878 RepID=UPI0031595A3C
MSYHTEAALSMKTTDGMMPDNEGGAYGYSLSYPSQYGSKYHRYGLEPTTSEHYNYPSAVQGMTPSELMPGYTYPMSFASMPHFPSALSPGMDRYTLGPNGKPKRRRVQTVAQRRAANIRERRRMFNLNSAFDSLRGKVPTFAYEKRLSRIETLRLAITYIAFMADLVKGKEPDKIKLHKLKTVALDDGKYSDDEHSMDDSLDKDPDVSP